MTKDEVQAILKPYHDDLHRCWERAWAKWKKNIGPQFQQPSKRNRANALHDLIREEVRSCFGERNRISIVDRTRFLMQIGDQLILQFKKLDDRFRTANLATQAALAFDDQALPLLPDMKPLKHVTVGYCLNKLGEARGFFVVYADGKQVRWCYELQAPASLAAFPVTPLGHPDVRVRGDGMQKEDEK